MFTAGVNYCWLMALLYSRQRRSQDLHRLHVLTSMVKVIVKYTAARSRYDFSASPAKINRPLEKKLGRKLILQKSALFGHDSSPIHTILQNFLHINALILINRRRYWPCRPSFASPPPSTSLRSPVKINVYKLLGQFLSIIVKIRPQLRNSAAF